MQLYFNLLMKMRHKKRSFITVKVFFPFCVSSDTEFEYKVLSVSVSALISLYTSAAVVVFQFLTATAIFNSKCIYFNLGKLGNFHNHALTLWTVSLTLG